jgi:hypothetical protein
MALNNDYGGAVLTPDIRFEGWTTETWMRFVTLHHSHPSQHSHEPGPLPNRERSQPRGGVVAIHERGRLKKLLHTSTGRLDPRATWPTDLAGLARSHRARWALSAESLALEELSDRFGARLKPSHDLTAQALLLVTLVRELLEEEKLECWPRYLRGVQPPTESMVHHALDALCPSGFAMVLGLFHHGEIWTAAVARRRGAGFDVLAGPEELRPHMRDMRSLSGNWQHHSRCLGRAVEKHYAPLALGCFAEVDRFRELLATAHPSAWVRAAIAGDVVISPMPRITRFALGMNGARFAFDIFRSIARQSEWVERLDPVGVLRALLRR